jgi:hypothetical protein
VRNVRKILTSAGVYPILKPMKNAATADRSHEVVSNIIDANNAARRGSYDGLKTSEIAEYNRRLMFGENNEAFPSQEEWSRIVD